MTTLRLLKENTEFTSRPPQDFFKTFLSVQEYRKLLMDYFKPTSTLFLPSSASTQLKLRLRLALFPADLPSHPATLPPRTVVSRTSFGVLLTVSRPLNEHFKTTKTMPRLLH